MEPLVSMTVCAAAKFSSSTVTVAVRLALKYFSLRTSLYIEARLLDEKNQFIMNQTELLVPCKQFHWQKPAFQLSFKDLGPQEGRLDGLKNAVEIQIRSSCFARSVEIDFSDFDAILSDNYFSICDATPYRIIARTNQKVDELRQHIQIQSVYDIR